MTAKTPKRPRDLNQWAKRMVDIATGEVSEKLTDDKETLSADKRPKDTKKPRNSHESR
jgi:hypothetical protein